MIGLLGAIIIFGAGLWLGGHPNDLPTGIRKHFVASDVAVKNELIDTIEQDYYKKVPRGDLETASLKGIVASLGDRFSRYLTPDESKAFNTELNGGEFAGVGVSVVPEKRGLLVTNVIPGSPAAKAGIRQAEVITAVNGSSIAGAAARTASDKIRGKPGTTVRLTVASPSGKTRTLTVKRAKLQAPLTQSRLVTRHGVKLGVAELSTFGEGAHGKLREDVDKLLGEGAKGIVLDLRGNGGGLLQEGRLVASIFLNKGLIVSTNGRASPEQRLYATGGAISPKIPVVVLVDGGTASASEIVTGALRDHDRATVVGEKTFGKGVFQQIEPLSNGGVLDLTVGRFFLPDGENLAGHGIVPQVKAQDNPRTTPDEALNTALRTLLSKGA
ncbi:MAG TPA: S41 family peptidase [Thermoleophilaceae bacterium]